MKLNKKLSILPVMLLVLALFAVSVSAITGTINYVEVDDIIVDSSTSNPIGAQFDKDNEYEVEVSFTPTAAYEDVTVEVMISGYDQRDRPFAVTKAFDTMQNITYTKRLDLSIPVRMDQKTYKLRVYITDADSVALMETYELVIEGKSHSVWIKDVVLNPSNQVEAGSALIGTVRLQNVGHKDEDDGVRVQMEIPALGIKTVGYVDELDVEDSVTTEELYMILPACAEPGTYEVNFEVVYRDGDEVETTTSYITIVDGGMCAVVGPEPEVDNTPVITAGIDVQNVVAGEGGAIYPITITNSGDMTRTFSIMTDVEAWANVRISPSNVIVIGPGQTQTAYVYLTAKENALVGQNIFGVTVKSGSTVIDNIALTANIVPADNVTDSSWSSLRKALEIGLVVLVIILVILGLVIGLRKMKKDNDEDGDESQTYY